MWCTNRLEPIPWHHYNMLKQKAQEGEQWAGRPHQIGQAAAPLREDKRGQPFSHDQDLPPLLLSNKPLDQNTTSLASAGMHCWRKSCVDTRRTNNQLPESTLTVYLKKFVWVNHKPWKMQKRWKKAYQTGFLRLRYQEAS